MKPRVDNFVIPGCLAVLGIVLLSGWLRTGWPESLQARVPGLDKQPGAGDSAAQTEATPVPGTPVAGDGTPSQVGGAWPGFRGPRRDAICDDGIRLAREFPPGGPPVLWSVPVGEGYAGAAIDGGRVFVLDYDEEAQADVMRCLSLDDGREIWRNGYPVEISPSHGISRTVPVVVDDYVIAVGPRCHVTCWDSETGDCFWLIDLPREHGTKVPRWYTGQCPLVDNGRLILAPCGDAMLIAVDYRTGEIIWQSPNPRKWEMTHSSIVSLDYQGRHAYIYCGSGGAAGIAADDGSLLWDTTEWPVQFATSPSPVVLPDDRIFLCSGYGSKTGGLILQLQETDQGTTVEVARRLTPRQFNSEQQTPVLFDGNLYAVRKHGRGQLVCLDLEGNEVWNSGADRFGHGPYMIADGLVLTLADRGELVVAEATAAGYKPSARCIVFEGGHEAWAPMAIAGGRLIVRDMRTMVCLDLSAK